MTSPSPAPDDKTPVATGVITRPPSAVGRRRNLLPNLALAGVIGALVLVFAL